MLGPKIASWLEQLLQNSRRKVSELDQRTHGWLGVLLSALGQTFQPYTTITAAAISYFTLFSIFPILLLSIALTSYNLNPFMGWHTIILMFEFIAPALDQLLGQNIAGIIQMRGPVTGVALVGLLWSGSTIFYMLTHTLNEIWGYKRLSAVWKRRGLAILLVLAVVGPLLFFASFASSIMDNVRTWLPDNLVIFGKGISFLVAYTLDVILLAIVYNLLPHGRATLIEILSGSMAAGILWELAKKGFLVFVSTYVNVSNLIYGSLAAIVAFLTWAYLSGIILLFGAYISLAYHKVNQRKAEGETLKVER
jgi:membrane protein